VPGALGAITEEQSGANVIVVTSGWGDDCYPTFIGYTGTRQVGSMEFFSEGQSISPPFSNGVVPVRP
jgi:hypothetical protein